MIIYPLVATAVGFDPHTTGIFLGATIHDVAQVVGAGYSVSTAAGDTATIVKLFRVALLLPAVFAISCLFRSSVPHEDGGARPPLLPAFLVAFAVLVAINSTGRIPQAMTTATAGRFALVPRHRDRRAGHQDVARRPRAGRLEADRADRRRDAVRGYSRALRPGAAGRIVTAAACGQVYALYLSR